MLSYRCFPRGILEDGEFALRTVQPDEIERIRQWRNAQLHVLRQERPIEADEQQAYFASAVWPQLDLDRPRTILTTFLEGGSPIGYGGLVHIAWSHARAEISFLLCPELAGDPDRYHPRFETFLRLIRRLAFDDLQLNRVFTETYAFRSGQIATLERNGFVREGVFRRHVIIDGKPIDSIIHGCLGVDRRPELRSVE